MNAVITAPKEEGEEPRREEQGDEEEDDDSERDPEKVRVREGARPGCQGAGCVAALRTGGRRLVACFPNPVGGWGSGCVLLGF